MFKKIKLIFFPCRENNLKAHFLEGNFLFSLVLFFFILKVLVLPFYIYFPKSVFFAKIVSSDILELLNNQRKSQGLNPLKEEPKLKEAAFLKANDMLEKDYFGHKSPTGIEGWYWIKRAGYDYEIAGENLAIGFLDSKEVHQAWNESDSHRKNLLAPYFQDIGIAVAKGEFQGNEVTVVVQFFGKPKIPIREKIIPPIEAKTKFPETKKIEEEKISPEKEINPIIENEISPTTEKEINPIIENEISPIEKEINPIQFGFWQFFVKEYDQILQKAIFFFSFLIIFTLILNLILTLTLKPKLLVLRETFFPLLAFFILIFLGFLEKSLILQLIPHSLKI